MTNPTDPYERPPAPSDPYAPPPPPGSDTTAGYGQPPVAPASPSPSPLPSPPPAPLAPSPVPSSAPPSVPSPAPSSAPELSGYAAPLPPGYEPQTAYGAGVPTGYEPPTGYGQPVPYAPAGYPGGYPAYDPATGLPYSEKSRVVAGILQLVLGGFGVGRFYTGHVGLAIAQIAVTWLTCGLGAIWPLIDGILLLVQGGTDSDGRVLRP